MAARMTVTILPKTERLAALAGCTISPSPGLGVVNASLPRCASRRYALVAFERVTGMGAKTTDGVTGPPVEGDYAFEKAAETFRSNGNNRAAEIVERLIATTDDVPLALEHQGLWNDTADN
jgi:hypothetical protein